MRAKAEPAIVTWPIGNLHPYGRNPRKNDHAVKQMAACIKEFGFKVPILARSSGEVVDGHLRLKAALSLGLTTVPVMLCDEWTDAQVKAFRIMVNKSTEWAEWDKDLLKLELADLQVMDDDLSFTGFDKAELSSMLENHGLVGDPDEAPPLPKKPITKPGDLWLLGDHRLLCGDSTKAEDVKKLMGGGITRMMFTDPPWNVAIGKDSNPRHRQRAGLENDDLSPQEFGEFLRAFIAAAGPFISGDVYVVLGASEWPRLDYELREAGYHWSATIIWSKDQFVLGRSKYHRRYEPIWYGWHASKKSSFGDARNLDDVWDVPRPKKSEEHPTMKPVEIPARAIQASSVVGDVILEPFSGSGTTLIAAEMLGRKCYALELAPGYCDVTLARWEKLTGKKATKA